MCIKTAFGRKSGFLWHVQLPAIESVNTTLHTFGLISGYLFLPRSWLETQHDYTRNELYIYEAKLVAPIICQTLFGEAVFYSSLVTIKFLPIISQM